MTPAGKLDQQITIQTASSGADELGQESTDWQDGPTVWAQATETPGRQFLSGDYQGEERVVFTTRWLEIDSTARVTWRGRVYRIENATGTYRSGERQLHCKATDGPN